MDSPRKYSSYTALIEDKRRHQMSLSPSRNTTTHHSPVSPVVNSPIRYTSSPTSGDNFKSQTALAEAKRRHKTELKYSPTKTKPIPVASPPRTPSGTATPLEIGSPGSLSSRSSECSSRRHHHHHSHQHNAAVQVPEVKKSPPSTPPLKYPHKWPSARTPPRTPEHQKHEHTEDHHHHHHSNSPCHHLSQNNFESDKRLHRTPLHHSPPLKEKSPEPKLRTVEGDPLHLSYHQLEHEKAQHRTPLRSASPDLLVQKPQANPIYNVDVWTDPRSHTQFEVAKSGNFIGSPLQPERPGNTRHLDSPRTP